MARKTPRIGGDYLARTRSSSPEEQPMLTTPVEAPPRPNLPGILEFKLLTHRPDFATERSVVHRTPTTLLRRHSVPITDRPTA